MASKVSSNIRELEGTLIRVTAFANLNRTPVDMALVQTVLKDLITLDEDNVISPVDIINHTAEYFKLDGMPTDELSKKAFTPDETALEMPVSDKSSDIDLILKEEQEIVMSGEKAADKGIADMNSRVKTEVQ